MEITVIKMNSRRNRGRSFSQIEQHFTNKSGRNSSEGKPLEKYIFVLIALVCTDADATNYDAWVSCKENDGQIHEFPKKSRSMFSQFGRNCSNTRNGNYDIMNAAQSVQIARRATNFSIFLAFATNFGGVRLEWLLPKFVLMSNAKSEWNYCRRKLLEKWWIKWNFAQFFCIYIRI